MPLYEYQCQDCNRQFEELTTSAADGSQHLPSCRHCGSTRVKKLISAGTVRTGDSLSALPSAPAGGCGSGGFS